MRTSLALLAALSLTACTESAAPVPPVDELGPSVGSLARELCGEAPDPVERLTFAPAFMTLDNGDVVVVFRRAAYDEHAAWLDRSIAWADCVAGIETPTR